MGQRRSVSQLIIDYLKFLQQTTGSLSGQGGGFESDNVNSMSYIMSVVVRQCHYHQTPSNHNQPFLLTVH
jgi:hypothetical protein